MNKAFRDKRTIFLMIFPGLAFLFFAMIMPIFLSIYYGMTDWPGIGPMNFVGLKNFREIILSDSVFWTSLGNAVKLTLVTLFLQNPLAVIVCIMILACRKNARFFRTVYYIPAIIPIVVTTKLWVGIFNPTYGLLNKFLSVIGLDFLATNRLSNPRTAVWSVILTVIWQGFGWAILFYYSGLVSIPNEFKEAALIDGAGGVKLYTKVILPLMMPVIRAVVIIALITCFKQMETVYLSTGGGPGNITQFLANYLYIKAFVSYEFGYGNALSILFVSISLLGTYLLIRFTRAKAGEY